MRVSLHIDGVVQGVGFRPFVYQRATALGLSGWIKNGRAGVEIEVSGSAGQIEQFCHAIKFELPLPGKVTSLSRRTIVETSEEDESTFRILASDETELPRPILPPDLATCADCMAEVLAPDGRRSGYPLTCCARCGPRYSIVQQLPYDRSRTTMQSFVRCADCLREYEDPNDRRFHAEPIACPRCGPQVSLLPSSFAPRAPSPLTPLLEGEGNCRSAAKSSTPQASVAEFLRAGSILAMRGLGGFQLLCVATNSAVVTELRRRKQRDDKPFAVLFKDLATVKENAFVSPNEEAALGGPAAPIVLLRKRENSVIAPEVAPNCPLIGAMLPTTALHQLVANAVDLPLVCTSGNLSGEPLCVDTPAAIERLGTIADGFLTHDRPIERPVDDSVVREGPFGLTILRRARGFAPLPVCRLADERCILGMGAVLKSTVALAVRGEVVVSQHLGDMDDADSVDLLERTVRDLVRFFDARPEVIACDLHPDFASTRLAERLSIEWKARLVRVQHHHAHIAAVLAEHGIDKEAFGLAWDGYGFGLENQAWGGEALVVSPSGFQRVGHLKPFRLPGGDVAAREPRRSALGLLAATLGQEALGLSKILWPDRSAEALFQAMERGFSAPWTTSMGRLFDAVAALLGIRTVCTFEGQAAMELEWLAATNPGPLPEPYPIPISRESPWIADLEPLVRALVEDLRQEKPMPEMAARFISSVVDVGVRFCERAGLRDVVLSGGCFQNDLMTRALVGRLEVAGFRPLLPAMVPVNDGGISLGQVAVASQMTMHQEGG